MKTSHPLILMILDGFGISHQTQGNAYAAAHHPHFDFVFSHFPKCTLAHSGIAVGLPAGVVGNSEVGHRSIGSGRIIPQTIQEIDREIQDERFYYNDALQKAVTHATLRQSAVHIIGLLSDGGAHAHIDHCLAVLQFLKRKQVTRPIYLHFFTDGRDTPPKVCLRYIEAIEMGIKNFGFRENQVTIATLGGRYYGMDRGGHWDRIQRHYDTILGNSEETVAPDELKGYIENQYTQGITDEFLKPFRLKGTKGVADNDTVIMFNFRPDRMRQLFTAFTAQDFPYFPREKRNNLFIATFTEYEEHTQMTNLAVAFPEPKIDQTLGQILSERGLTQLHIAESEKAAHVTYFFNGGRREPYVGEKDIIVPSPTSATYDLTPAMSTNEIINTLIEHITLQDFDLYVANIAATDMVAHTGNFDAAVSTIEAVDASLGRLWDAIEQHDGILVITGDHGNIEAMIDPKTGEKDTEHNIAPVPFVLCSPQLKYKKASPVKIEDLARNPSGTLADIMPTILELYNLPMPAVHLYPEQVGTSLLKRLR